MKELKVQALVGFMYLMLEMQTEKNPLHMIESTVIEEV